MSEATQTDRNSRFPFGVFAALTVVLQLAMAAALTLQAGYSGSGLTYLSPITPGTIATLWARGWDAGIASRIAASWPFLAVTCATLVVAFVTRRSKRSAVRASVFAIQCVLFLPAWLFLVALVLDIYAIATGQLDGEWLGEEFPPLEVLALWVLLCAAGAITSSNTLMRWLARMRPRAWGTPPRTSPATAH